MKWLQTIILGAVLIATPAYAQVRPELGGTGSLSNTGTNNSFIIGNAAGTGFEEDVPSGTCDSSSFLRFDDTQADGARLSCAAESGATNWDAIGPPSGAGSIAMAETAQTLDWNTGNATAAVFDGLTLTYTGDATTTDSGAQRLLVLTNESNAETTAPLDRAIVIDNKDGDALTTAIEILGSSTGAVTTAIDLSDAEIGVAIALGSNDITTGTGTITSAELDILQDGLIALASEVSGTLPVANGGTGAISFTDGGILLGSDTGAITALGAAANGEIPIGDGTTDPVLATITGTTDEITVTNGAGSITLAFEANASAKILIVDEEADGTLLYDGNDKIFTLQNTPLACSNVQISFNGYVMEQVGALGANNHYTCSGTTITFQLAPASGDHVAATYTL